MGLFPHQIEAVRRMALTKAFLLADEPGLGKTATICTVVRQVYTHGNVLIICPRNVIRHWKDSLDLWAPGLSPAVTVTNYERIQSIPQGLNPSIVILDESHKLKNERSKRFLALWERWQSWSRAAAMVGLGMRVYLSTGTPVYSYPIDLMTALLLMGYLSSDRVPAFKLRYCDPQRRKLGGRMVLDVRGASNLAELKQVCEPFMLRRSFQDAGVTMPKLTMKDLPVPVAAITDPDYHAASDDWKTYYMEHGGKPGGESMARFTGLRKILALAKVPAAVEQALDDLRGGQKVLVLTGFRESAEHIHAALEAAGETSFLVMGGQSTASRDETFEAFKQGDKPKALVATSDSLGEGVDGLQNTCRIAVFVDLDFDISKFVQLVRRLWRLKQNFPVSVRRLFVEGDDMEAFIQGNLTKKEKVLKELGLQDSASMSQIRL